MSRLTKPTFHSAGSPTPPMYEEKKIIMVHAGWGGETKMRQTPCGGRFGEEGCSIRFQDAMKVHMFWGSGGMKRFGAGLTLSSKRISLHMMSHRKRRMEGK